MIPWELLPPVASGTITVEQDKRVKQKVTNAAVLVMLFCLFTFLCWLLDCTLAKISFFAWELYT